MVWIKQKYTQLEIDRAGKTLVNPKSTDEEKNKALNILDNWRAVNSYPMHIFQMRLKRYGKKVEDDPLIAQRLKRVPSIIFKLKREYGGRTPSMNLHQMQDIGGCRIILQNVSNAKELCEKYFIKGELKHKRVSVKDYISKPKEDGYRSIHLVYKYFSDKNKKEFNGLLTEVQIRSKLQHLWATAVETVGFFTRQAIKSNEGSPEWIEFFKLVSSAFAKLENCPTVPNTPQNEKELFSKIKEKEKELNVINKMTGWTNAMQEFFTEDTKKKKIKFFLLELDIIGEKLNIKGYMEKQEQQAVNDYSILEKRHNNQRDYDVVLVGVDTANDLRKAYPNYFVDSEEFLINLKKIIDKA